MTLFNMTDKTLWDLTAIRCPVSLKLCPGWLRQTNIHVSVKVQIQRASFHNFEKDDDLNIIWMHFVIIHIWWVEFT